MTAPDRRAFLRIGGVSIAMATVVAACGGSDDDSPRRARPPRRARADITRARTASSLEHVAAVIYGEVITTGLITTRVAVQLARLFRSHHEEHAAVLERATRDLGGRPFREANPAVLEQLKSAISAAQDEMTAVQLLFDVETMISETYQSSAVDSRAPSLTVAAMSVAGAEARHAAALATLLGLPGAPNAFQATDHTVEAGTGV